MANEEKLEDIAKTAPVNTEAKNSDSSENLEGKVKRGLGSRLWGFTKVAGTTGIAAAIGGIGAAATIGGYMAADLLFRKKEFKKDAPKRTAETLHQANFATGINKGYFAVTNSIDSVIGKGGAGLALITPYNLLFIPVAYAIEKYKFGGFIKNMALHPFRTMKDIYDNTYKNGEVWNGIKESYKWLTLPLLATIYFVPQSLQLAAAAGLAFVYKTILALGKKKKPAEEKSIEEKTAPAIQPQYSPQQTPYRRAA